MKKMLFVILLFIALNGSISLYAQHTATLYPVADVYIRTLGGGDGHCSFIKFDISSIPPGNKIDSAKLGIYVHEMSMDYALNNDMLFMRMDGQDWIENDNSNILITDTVIQEDGLVAGPGWNYSEDLSALLVHDYGMSNSFFTVVLKDSNDITVMPSYFENPEDNDDSLEVGLLPKYIIFYPHESDNDSLIPELTVDYTIIPDIISESGDSSKCEGESASFYVSATGDMPLNYQWQKDGADITGAKGSTFSINSVSVDSAGDYRCIVSNSGGSDTSDIKELIINTLPNVNIIGSDTACGSTVLDEGIGMPGDIYLWSTGETTQMINVTESGTYGLTVIDGNGCAGSDAIDVVIYPMPEIDLGSDTVILAGSSLLLDAGAGYDSYLWSNDSTTQTILVDSTGIGLGYTTYFVTVTDNECQAVDSITVTYVMPFTDMALVFPPSGLAYSCEISEETNVPAMIMNTGNTIIPASDTIFGFYRVDTEPVVSDSLILQSDFYPGNIINFSFDQTADMGEPRLYNYKIYFYYKDDQNADNDSVNGQVEHINPPVINLGNDTMLCDNQSIVLDAGPGYHDYIWSDYSTDQTLTVDINNSGWGPNTFYVAVYYYDCVSSDTIEVTFVICDGLTDVIDNQELDFYADPAGNSLNIFFTGAANRTIELQVVNIQGQVIFNDVYSETSGRFIKQVNISGYTAGIYIIKVKSNNIIKTEKFIIK
jgi:hypothetical protein